MGKRNSCHICKETSCGLDSHTRTKYAKERNIGDRQKVILLQVYDMIEIDNLQIHEILGLLTALVNHHVEETEQ